MNRYILPHLYLFFGIIVYILAEELIQVGAFYWWVSIGSILFIITGLTWIITLLFSKKNN